MNLAGFRASYTEFAETADGVVNAKLAEAATQIDATLYGSTYDLAHGLLTAHLLASAPGGQMARLKKDEKATTYWVAFVELRDSAGCGIRVFA